MSFANFSHFNKVLIVFFPGIGNTEAAYDLVISLDLLQLGPEGEKCT